MNRMHLLHPALAATLALALAGPALPASAAPEAAGSDWAAVARVLQTPDVFAGGYHRFNLPRKDITLKLGDVTVAPELALGAWAGFGGEPDDAMMMGDLVLKVDELNPVLAELARQKLEVTAIHNHLAGEEPRLMYVHFHGRGTAIDLATRLDHAVALTSTPRPVTAAAPKPLDIDTSLVFTGLGKSGRAAGSVAQVGFILVPGKVTMHGGKLIPALAYGSPVNIQSVGPDRAVATGDFSVLGPAVQPLLAALASHGITATALHTHMIGESPTLYFIHFWADGRLDEVVRGLRAAVDAAK